MALRVYPTLSNRARRLDSHPALSIAARSPQGAAHRWPRSRPRSGGQVHLARKPDSQGAVWCPVGLIAALVILR